MALRLLTIVDRYSRHCEKGSEVFCTKLTRALMEKYDVTVLTTSESDTVPEGDGVIRISDDLMTDIDALKQFLQKRLPLDSFDVIYNLSGMLFGNTIVSILIGMHGRLPLVNHFQTMLGSYASEEGYSNATVAFNRDGQKEVAEQAILNIFLSQSEYRDALLSGFDIGNSLVSVVPAGVDYSEIEDVPREVAPIERTEGKKRTVFLTSGRFSDFIKGGDLIYRAFSYLYRSNPDVFLLVVSNSARFQELLKDLPQDSYRTIDWLPRGEFLKTIASADVVVLPSRYESFGLIAVEAMMLHKPVIANNVGGLQEIVHHGATGILNELRDGSFGLYKAMKVFADQPDVCRAMGRAAHKHAVREFELGRVSELTSKSFDAALVRHRSLAAGSPFTRLGLMY